MDRKSVCAELDQLNEATLKDLYRFMDLACFTFQNKDQIYNLHIQSDWRLTLEDEIILAREDIYCEDQEDTSKFDRTVCSIPKDLAVKSWKMTPFGDLTLSFQSSTGANWMLHSFSDSSGHDEMWRLIHVDTEKAHLVCYPSGFAFE